MARSKATPPRVPDAVREAVERTIQATLETRGRAQEAMDDLVRGAEAGAGAFRERVRGAIEVGRPATYEDIRELGSELRAIARRLDAIESRLASPSRGSSSRGRRASSKTSTRSAGTRRSSKAGSSRRASPRAAKRSS